MPILTVKNFSCIEDATIELSKMTVLIGPQASGKSVLSKLIYFFVDLLEYQFSIIDDSRSLDEFSERVKQRFVEWFPISAWGKAKFSLQYKSGKYEVRISRNAYNKEINDNIRLYFSAFFKTQYQALLNSGKKTPGSSAKERLEHEFERRYQLRRISAKFLRENLGDDYYSSQLFIPAGRSFFTSLGRAVMAFEHGQILDPITIQFGRTFSSFRGLENDVFSNSSVASQLLKNLGELMGGDIVYEGEKAYIVSKDGRKVPYSALSSGQQELLPLVMVLCMMGAYFDRNDHQLLYIEEPEAHLFPLAQSKLIAILTGYALDKRRPSTLIMTTHSPYVLAKLNTLLKAGQLGLSASTKKITNAVAAIVPPSQWLPPDSLSAYALIDGKAVDIIDKEGFVDGDYLDDVSSVISAEFSALLDVEFPSDK